MIQTRFVLYTALPLECRRVRIPRPAPLSGMGCVARRAPLEYAPRMRGGPVRLGCEVDFQRITKATPRYHFYLQSSHCSCQRFRLEADFGFEVRACLEFLHFTTGRVSSFRKGAHNSFLPQRFSMTERTGWSSVN